MLCFGGDLVLEIVNLLKLLRDYIRHYYNHVFQSTVFVNIDKSQAKGNHTIPRFFFFFFNLFIQTKGEFNTL